MNEAVVIDNRQQYVLQCTIHNNTSTGTMLLTPTRREVIICMNPYSRNNIHSDRSDVYELVYRILYTPEYKYLYLLSI